MANSRVEGEHRGKKIHCMFYHMVLSVSGLDYLQWCYAALAPSFRADRYVVARRLMPL